MSHQQLWFKRLKESLENRLQKLRKSNDEMLDEPMTAHIRGQIQEIKNLLKDMERDMEKQP